MNTLMKIVLYSSSLLLHVFSWTSQALESPTFHIVDTHAYLSTSNVCNSIFNTGSKNKRSSTFKMVDRLGPCFSHKTGSKLSLSDIISRDQSRVDEMSRPSNLDSAKSYRHIFPPESFNASTYVVTMELGTPVQQVAFLFSISTGYTYAQCAPWYNSSGDETTFFNSTASTTFSNIACDAPECNQDCSADITHCNIGDPDSSPLFLSKDNLTVDIDVIPEFVFGCGERIPELNGSIAGILGFSRDNYSFISQFNKVFSYCLPQNATQLGYLRFGDDEAYNNTMLTDLVDCPFNYPWSYCIDITAIAVADVRLQISPSIFETSMIDFDMAFTYLPPDAYARLKAAFTEKMANYTPARPHSLFDTCYDTSNSPIIEIPTVSFTIGDVPVPMDPSGILFPIDNTTVSCLAFIGNNRNYTIFGSTQQKGLKVMFDVRRRKIGFGKGGDCVPYGG